jgi:hypothetical protein
MQISGIGKLHQVAAAHRQDRRYSTGLVIPKLLQQSLAKPYLPLHLMFQAQKFSF